MGEQERRSLLALLGEDEQFRATFVAATTVDEAVAIAADRGLPLSPDDLRPADDAELTDTELEVVAGGAFFPFFSGHDCG